MNDTSHHDARIANMTFASVYPLYVIKVAKKGRTKEELHQVITWFTAYDQNKLPELIESKVTFEPLSTAANLYPPAQLITRVKSGYRIETIKNPLTPQVRYLEKLVDDLANGSKMEKRL